MKIVYTSIADDIIHIAENVVDHPGDFYIWWNGSPMKIANAHSPEGWIVTDAQLEAGDIAATIRVADAPLY